MRILFFINRFAGGGAERVMATLANNLVKRGHEIYIDFDTDFESAYKLDSRIIFLNYQKRWKSTKVYNYKVLRFIKKLHLIRETVKTVEPACVVSFVTEINGPVLLATIGLDVPKVVSEHTRIYGFNNNWKNKLIKTIIYRFSDVVTVLTRHDYKLWKKYGNVVYMPNPIELCIDDINVESKENIVLGVGRIDDYKVKGLDTLLQCWSRVCLEFPDWRLFVAGDGSEQSKTELQQINEELQNQNVYFLGFRKDIDTIMRNSSVFILPSRVEGLPMGLIEAMNQKCCCISFDVPTGPAEIIQNKYSGELIENQNIEALSNSLREVMSNKQLREYYSSNAQNSIKKFSVDNIIRRWEILFNVLTK